MPHLILLAASGTSQRRLIEETVNKFKSQGADVSTLDMSSSQASWGEIFSHTGGLFAQMRLVVIEEAQKLGNLDDAFAPFMESPGVADTVLLIYPKEPPKGVFGDLISKMSIIKPQSIARFGAARASWVEARAKEHGLKISRASIALLADAFEDQEEIRGEIEKLALLQDAKNTIDDECVAQLCLGDDSKVLLQFLDALCKKNIASAIKALETLKIKGDFIPLLTALHNRFRLAWLAVSLRASDVSLGAKPYAWGLSQQAAKIYGQSRIVDFVKEIISLNIQEKMGLGRGWCGLTGAVLRLVKG